MTDKPTLLPQNSTTLERAIEQSSSGIQDIAVLASALWNADTCPAPLLGWLAWAMSVDVWESHWDEEQKRATIRRAPAIHRVKGTIGAVRRALGSLGIRIDITEWFEYGGVPGTFKLDAFADNIFDAGMAINPALLEMVEKVIVNVKPASRHFELRVGERFDGAIFMRAGVRSTVKQTGEIAPQTRTTGATAIIYLRTAHRSQQISNIHHDVIRRAA